MKAPDKIYVREYPVGLNQVWDEKPKVRTVAIAQHEYIRKDALIEYFHNRVEELNSPLNGVFGSTEREHCNERISELLLLVDKINSI